MAFNWSENINNSIKTTEWQEIRNNVDYVYDNPDCHTHHGNHCSDEDGTVYDGHNNTYDGGDDGGYDSGDNNNHDAGDHYDNYSTYYPSAEDAWFYSDRSDAETSERAANNGNYDEHWYQYVYSDKVEGESCNDYCFGHHGVVCSDECNLHYSDEFRTVFSQNRE